LRISGVIGLGPGDEKLAMVGAATVPTSVAPLI